MLPAKPLQIAWAPGWSSWFYPVLLYIFSGLICPDYSLYAAEQTTEKATSTALYIGIFPRRNATVTQNLFEPLRQELSRVFNRPVELETTYDFATFWENVSQHKYDVVHYNQYHYIKSHKQFGYNVIAQNVEFGQSRMAAAITVRKNSGINSLKDLKGKKVVFGGGRSAMIAYISATYLLRQAGLKDGDYFEQFALNPPKAVIATYYQQATAAGASHYVLSLPQVENRIRTREMKYLAVGKKMANLPWAVKPELSADIVTKLKSHLLQLHKTSRGQAILRSARIDRFAKVSNADYDSHREIVEAVLGEHY